MSNVYIPVTVQELFQNDQRFPVVTSLLVIEDSVRTWVNCTQQEMPVQDKKTDYTRIETQYNCTRFNGYYTMYKGVFVLRNNKHEDELFEVGFLSHRKLTKDDLSFDEETPTVLVTVNDRIQIEARPGVALVKTLMYVE